MALLTLDSQRMEAGRADCMPWLELTIPDASPASLTFELEDPPADGARSHIRTGATTPKNTFMQRGMQHLHRKLAMPAVKLGVLLLVVLGCMASLSAVQRIQVGLDQTVALPRDSYLQTYYRCASITQSALFYAQMLLLNRSCQRWLKFSLATYTASSIRSSGLIDQEQATPNGSYSVSDCACYKQAPLCGVCPLREGQPWVPRSHSWLSMQTPPSLVPSISSTSITVYYGVDSLTVSVHLLLQGRHELRTSGASRHVCRGGHERERVVSRHRCRVRLSWMPG
jgi:hypothetical protein